MSLVNTFNLYRIYGSTKNTKKKIICPVKSPSEIVFCVNYEESINSDGQQSYQQNNNHLSQQSFEHKERPQLSVENPGPGL